MRVMYIHAGKRINKDLKADEYHVDLFRDKLKLRFQVPSHRKAMQNLFMDNDSSMQAIEKLPRGQILGVAIFNETYWFDQRQHMNDPWKLGPFCYEILDVFRLEKGVHAIGQLGIWTPKQEAQNQILQQISVQNKINEWKQTYGDRLYFGSAAKNGVPSAITILQPFVEGILRGIKRVENRKRPFFKLHENKSLYKHPIAPKPTQCRFCPSDGSKCMYWAHVKDQKRKIRNHKRLKNTNTSTPSPITPTSDDDVDLNQSETEEDYSSDENGTIEYNTRSRRSKTDSFIMAGMNGNKKNRKRKRSEINGHGDHININTNNTPPHKKHKKSKKKKHRKHRHSRSKKRKREIDLQQWEAVETDLLVGEDGIEPLRMCYHGKTLRPIVNPMSAPKECDICKEMVSWDNYYECDCNNMQTIYCFHHTRPVKLETPQSWINTNMLVNKYPDGQKRNELIHSLQAPPGYYVITKIRSHKKKSKRKKKHKSNSNKVGVDIRMHIRKKKKKRNAEIINNGNNYERSDSDSDSDRDARIKLHRGQKPVANGNNNNNNFDLKFDPAKMKMPPLFNLNFAANPQTILSAPLQQIQVTPQPQLQLQQILQTPQPKTKVAAQAQSLFGNNNVFKFNLNLDVKLNMDPNAINNSINAIQTQPKQPQKPQNGYNINVNNNNNNSNNNNKMDFSNFPTNITPTISNGSNQAAFVYNSGNMSIHSMAQKSNVPTQSQQQQPLQSQPIMTTAILSLSQILNQNNNVNINTNNNINMNNNNNTNSNNNTNVKVTPVPSPFAPSPSPTNNNINSNNNIVTNTNINSTNPIQYSAAPSMSNVYALQNFLNSNNKSNQNNIKNANECKQTQSISTVPNPFGPISNNTNTTNQTNSNNINNNNNSNDTSQNPTETTSNTSSTASINNTNHKNTKNKKNKNKTQSQSQTPTPTQSQYAKNMGPYFGQVIAPSYQSMPHHPMQLQQYNTIPTIQNINGQMMYVVPGQQYYPNGMVPFYQYPQYSQPQNKANIPVPVPVQQT